MNSNSNIADRYLARLRSLGFSVEYSNDGRASKSINKKTRQIKRNGRWLGIVTDKNLAEENTQKVYLTYRFHKGWHHNGNENREASVPPDFDKGQFCEKYGLAGKEIEAKKGGNSKDSYLRIYDDLTAISLLEQASEESLAISGPADLANNDNAVADSKSNVAEALEDIEDINARDLPPTTKKALIDARLGQGKYRKQLDLLFDKKCAVSGIPIRETLRASHIVAFNESDDRQRLDANNGLLLCVALDALFDKHLISFDGAGAIMLSKRLHELTSKMLSVLAPLNSLLAKPSAEQQVYLRLHNAKFQRLENALLIDSNLQ